MIEHRCNAASVYGRSRSDDAPMPGKPFESDWTPAQRDAVAAAIVDRNMSAPAACAAAARGELAGLAPYEVKPATARSWARKLRDARARHERESVATRDVGSTLRVLTLDLVDAIEGALRSERAKPAGKRDVERLRQIGRAIREAQAIADPGARRPAKPGHTRDDDGRQREGATRGGIAGDLLRASRQPGTVATHDGATAPADDTGHGGHNGGDDTTRNAHGNDAGTGSVATEENDHDDGTPAGVVRAELARIADPA